MGRYERPLKLKTNKIPYLIPGGGMIDRFHPWGEERNLIGYETTEMFAMKSALCHDACERENHVFMVGLVLKGNGWVEYGDHVRIPVKKGTELFIPHGVKHYRYIPEKNMEVLECYPPQI